MNASELEKALDEIVRAFGDFGYYVEQMASGIRNAFTELGDSLSELGDMFNHVYDNVIKEKPIKPRVYGMSLIPNTFHDPMRYYRFDPPVIRHLPYQRRNY